MRAKCLAFLSLSGELRASLDQLSLTVLLVGAGLGTGYFFVQSGREAQQKQPASNCSTRPAGKSAPPSAGAK